MPFACVSSNFPNHAQPRRSAIAMAAAVAVVTLSGCAQYAQVSRPAPQLSILSPELRDLTDDKIKLYLTASAQPPFPGELAVAKVALGAWAPGARQPATLVEPIRGEEAAGWKALARDAQSGAVIERVELVSGLLADGEAGLKGLRNCAALLHAPILVVYTQSDEHAEGSNEASMAYWTIVGLFCVPGTTVGHYSVCQGVIVDTLSGVILATVEGEGMREERVLPGAVDIATDRTRRESRAAAIVAIQRAAREKLAELAKTE